MGTQEGVNHGGVGLGAAHQEVHGGVGSAAYLADLFGGSGTTVIAAEQLGRTAYVMELEPKYASVILDRYEKFTGQKPELLQE